MQIFHWLMSVKRCGNISEKKSNFGISLVKLVIESSKNQCINDIYDILMIYFKGNESLTGRVTGILYACSDISLAKLKAYLSEDIKRLYKIVVTITNKLTASF